jgi:hypothetical protein
MLRRARAPGITRPGIIGVGRQHRLVEGQTPTEEPQPDEEPDLSAARAAFLAALASVHPSRRGAYAAFLVGDDPRQLSAPETVGALAALPKPVLLHAVVRADRTLRLRVVTGPWDPRRHAATAGGWEPEAAAVLARVREQYGRTGAGDVRILARGAGEEFFMSPAGYAQLVRDYGVLNGGWALDKPDTAAAERRADALLKL